MCAAPARYDHSEPSTLLCSLRDATTSGRPQPTAGHAPGVPPVCATSGASRSQQAEHVFVPLAQREPQPACYGRLSAGRAPGGPLLCATPARCDHSEPSTSPCSSRDGTLRPRPACYGRRRVVHRVCHLCVLHPARHDRSEPSTSSCRSRDVTPRLPSTAGGGMCAGRATCVCSIRRVAITVSRARTRAAHAMRPPACLSWLWAGGAPGVPPACAASGASRSQ